MTTLVALATKECVVLGCDSLGTQIGRLVDPGDLFKFFDPDKDYALKSDPEGKPLLKSFRDIYGLSKETPVHHLTRMTKLFSLEPLRAGVLLTGIISIGDRTIRSLVEEFRIKQASTIEKNNYSVKDLVDALVLYLWEPYQKQFPDETSRPGFELILGGYGKDNVVPEIYRLYFSSKSVIHKVFDAPGFGLTFGGQMKEIQRLVFGTDSQNKLNIKNRHEKLLQKYREKVIEALQKQNVSAQIPDLTFDDDLRKELDFFGDDWRLDKFEADWEDFSEQNAIECVDFFVNIMIKSQQFGSGMPTVGGEVHIALITPNNGLRFISKEQFVHEGHFVPKHIV